MLLRLRLSPLAAIAIGIAIIVAGRFVSNRAAHSRLDPGRDAFKTLRLAGPPGARDADLQTCVSILNRRFERAEIPAKAKLADGGRIQVDIVDQPEVMRAAGTLLAAGGHLQFKAIVADTAMSDAAQEKEIARIRALKARRAYDEASERYDALENERKKDDWVLVENEGGVEGHLVSGADATSDGSGGYEVSFEMTPEGSDEYFRFTTRIQGHLEATIMDGVVKAICRITSAIHGSGSMTCKPPYTKDEALTYAALLSSGRLPIDLSLEEDAPDMSAEAATATAR